MSYAAKNLAPGETIVYRARYHWIYYKTTLALLLLAAVLGLWWWVAGRQLGAEGASSILGKVALVLLVAAVVHFLVRRIRASADEYVVTSRRVIRKYGMVAREVEQALLDRIQDVTLRQSVAGRLLGYGTVVLETASETGRLVFPDIAEPEKFRSAIWERIPGAASPGVPPSAASPAGAAAGTFAGSAQISAAARLVELETLHKQGLLTTDEYVRKREEILGSL